MSEPLIIALVGISGVGKTTFLKRLSSQLDFQHLTAGSLIRRARNIEEISRDDLRLADIDGNQRLLIEGFHLACDRSASHVILDGHCIIHDDLGLEYIDSRVFSELGIEMLVHLEADLRQIQTNRAGDFARNRPFLEIDELQAHQLISFTHAQAIASKLGISFKRVSPSDLNSFLETIS